MWNKENAFSVLTVSHAKDSYNSLTEEDLAVCIKKLLKCDIHVMLKKDERANRESYNGLNIDVRNFIRLKVVKTLEQVTKYPGMGQPLASGEFFLCLWGRYRRDDLNQEAGIRHQRGEMGYITIRVDINLGELDNHSPTVLSSNVCGVTMTGATDTGKRVSNTGMGRCVMSLSGSTTKEETIPGGFLGGTLW